MKLHPYQQVGVRHLQRHPKAEPWTYEYYEGPVTHLILGSRSLCCDQPTRDLPLTDLLTADPALADCRG